MSFQDTRSSVDDDERPVRLNSGGNRRKDFRQPYGWQNPPPSLDAAIERLDELEDEIASIESQLDFAERPDMDDNDYDRWYSKATKAHSFKKKELSFVERWIAAWRAVDEEGLEIVIEGTTPFTKQILLVKTTAEEVRKAFEQTQLGKRTRTRKTVDTRSPADRLKELERWQIMLERVLRDLRRWAKMCRLRHETAEYFKAPALEMLALLHTEMLEIKDKHNVRPKAA